jgi:hypothetical protein
MFIVFQLNERVFMKSVIFSTFAFCCLFTASGFATDANASKLEKATAYARVQGIYDSINTLADAGNSCEKDSDCGRIAIAEQACGGTSAWAITSKNSPYWESLEVLGAFAIKAKSDMTKSLQMFSTCTLQDTPVISCTAKKCSASRPGNL